MLPLSPLFSLRHPWTSALLGAALLFPSSIPLHATPQDDLEAIIAQHYPWAGSVGPGLIVGVWEGDSVVSITTRGYADLDLPLTGEGFPGGLPGPNALLLEQADRMRIASLTKSFTVTRVLQLAAAGDLSLDDPLSKFAGLALPDSRGVLDISQLAVDPARFASIGDVTLRDLARMTSTIADYSTSPQMIAAMESDLTTWHQPETLLSYANNLPPTLDPWMYSNTNTLLLGLIVEAVTGNALGEEIKTHVIDRAGLTNTFYPTDNAIPGDHAHGYFPDDNGVFDDSTHVSPSIAAGGGAMISNFDDLSVWIEAIATGRLADGRSLYGDDPLYDYDLLQLERLIMVDADGPGPHYDGYGLGIGELEQWVGHSGEFFGYLHMIMYDPATGRKVVIMLNASGLPNGEHLPIELFTDIAQYYAAIPEPQTMILLVSGAALLFAVRRRRSIAA